MAKRQKRTLDDILTEKLLQDKLDLYHTFNLISNVTVNLSKKIREPNLELLKILKDTELICKTNLDKESLSKERTAFNTLRQQDEEFNILARIINFDLIRYYLVKSYVKEQIIPSELPFADEEYLEMNNLTWFPSLLAHHGFVFKKLAGSKKKILAECTESLNKRVSYLLEMKSYRELQKHIVYASPIRYEENNATFSSFVAVSNSFGLINLEDTKNMNDNTFSMWLQNKVLSKVEESSVIVLNNVSFLQKTLQPITMYSSKKDMIACLEENDVPFVSDMHKSELLTILEKSKCKKLVKSETASAIARHNSHVMYTPDGVSSIHFIKFNTDNSILDSMKTSSKWKQYEQIIIQAEKDVLNEDSQVEEVVDSLLTYAKYNGIQKDEIFGFENQSKVAMNGIWIEKVMPGFNKD